MSTLPECTGQGCESHDELIVFILEVFLWSCNFDVETFWELLHSGRHVVVMTAATGCKTMIRIF
jgi:hypothetical protein